MAKEIRVNFSQIFRLDERDLARTQNGYLILDVRVSRIGVMLYRDSAGKPYNEYKPPEELFKEDTMKSLQYVPVTNKHPREVLVRPYNCKRLSVGMVVDEGIPEQKYYLKSKIVVTDEEIIKSIYNKFRNGESQEVSAGYEATIQKINGRFNGEDYTSVQKDIRFNHLALVDLGRAGQNVKLIWPEAKMNSGEFIDFRYADGLL